MAKLFVGWQSSAPRDKALTYEPADFECSQPASLADVAEYASADFSDEGPADSPFVDSVATGDQFELKEGLFIASWAPGATQPDEYFLYFVNMVTNQKYKIW